jgi:lipid II:glycine glycyltransferase (peptidoglycan interpeptide bridge formation enzyme)
MLKLKNICQPEGGLLQSVEWARFWRVEGFSVIKIQVKNNSLKKIFFGQINRLSLVGKYLYLPRLVLRENFPIKTFLEAVKIEMAKNNLGWLRVDLFSQKDLQIIQENCQRKIIKAPHDMQPKDHLIINLTPTEDELLKQMKSKTRYNIHLAKRKGVKIFEGSSSEYLPQFFTLINKTAQRKNVNFHSFNRYEKMFKSLPEDCIKLYLAEYDGKIIAANIITFYQGVATYLHGGLDANYRKVMAPFLLQWKVMQIAKKKNCQWYDLGGVFLNTKDNGKVGITRFKRGFAPKTEIFQTVGTYDIVFSPFKYWIYRGLQRIKSLIK